MTTSDQPSAQNRKRLHQILTFILWLLTVALGLLAIPALVRGVDAQVLVYIFERVRAEDMGPMTASTLSRTANLGTVLITGALWLGLVVFGGSNFHFKRAGRRSSFRMFAWTIGVELVLIVVGNLLQAT